MTGRRALGVGLAVSLSGGLAACESSQTKSARLEKAGKGSAELGTVDAGAKNRSAKVLDTSLFASEALGTAVVVKLDNTGPEDQVAVPIQIDVKDAKKVSVYKNDLDGLQPALQQLALLRRGKPAYWVNDQVTAATPAKTVSVEVGKAKGKAPKRYPDVRLEKVRLDTDSSGVLATGVVKNFSKITQVNMPIYAVVESKGGKIVAAGRGLIEKLVPEPQKKPTVFRIYLLGKPRGGKLSVTPLPTVFKKGG